MLFLPFTATTPPHKDDVTNPLQLKGSPSSKTLKALASFKSFTERATGRDSPSKSPPPSKSSRGSSIPVTVYSVADLQTATNSFGQENLVGENSLGCVYRGIFQDDQVLAVKVLDKSATQVQSEQDFLKLVSNIAHIQHANITELVGYCVEHGQRLLVYKYVSNGTLHEALHCCETTATKKHLSWSARAKIALGVARALEYLHEICLPAVVHHNFNSGNILLDDELNPQLSDCGIADLSSPASVSQVSPPPPQMLASVGYSAPEDAMSGVYTMKSDVYRFGVVMLELLTGRKPLDSSRPRAEESLVRWATPQLHDIDTLTKMVDPALKGIYPVKSLSRFADVIALCVQPEPEFRPPMSEVVQALLRLLQRANLSKQQAGENVGRSRNRSLEFFHDSYTVDISS
jgi:serine/threonine protein kinase